METSAIGPASLLHICASPGNHEVERLGGFRYEYPKQNLCVSQNSSSHIKEEIRVRAHISILNSITRTGTTIIIGEHELISYVQKSLIVPLVGHISPMHQNRAEIHVDSKGVKPFPRKHREGQ